MCYLCGAASAMVAFAPTRLELKITRKHTNTTSNLAIGVPKFNFIEKKMLLSNRLLMQPSTDRPREGVWHTDREIHAYGNVYLENY
jgi:hypothetical protein